jgi:DNA-binding PadR family transcriptional regulator
MNNMRQKEHPLPNTSYAILGILSFGQELSGYEIRKWAQNLRFFYWSPAQSQVYSELQRLEEHGFVVSREVKQEEKPDKRLYQITQQGAAELRRWLEEESAETTVIKHSVALRLFFGHVTTPAILIDMLKKYAEELNAMLGQLGVVQEFMENEPGFAYPALVAEWSHHYYAAELVMVQQLVEQLRKLSNS